MERTPLDDDDKDKPKAKAPIRPLAKILDLKKAESFVPPKEKVELPTLSPSILRVEARAEPAPAEQPRHTETLEQIIAHAETKHDDEEDDDEGEDTPAPISPLPWLKPPPAPEVTSSFDNVEDMIIPAAHPPNARSASAPEVAFFSRDEAAPEAHFAAAAEQPEEPIVAWQQHAPTPVEAAPSSSPAVEQASETGSSDAGNEFYTPRRAKTPAQILTVALTGWFNQKFNRQFRENQESFYEMQQQHAQQNADTQRLHQQVRAQGQHLEQVTATQQQAVHENNTTAAEVERLRQQRALAAEQAAALQTERVAADGLAPGQRLERSWYDEVVDKDGRVVEGAIEHGRAYHEEKQAEAAAYRVAQAQAAAAQNPYDDAGYQALMASHNPALPSGKVNPPYTLPSNQVDSQHLLEGRSQLVSTALNPVVWVGVAILLFAFLSAAFL